MVGSHDLIDNPQAQTATLANPLCAVAAPIPGRAHLNVPFRQLAVILNDDLHHVAHSCFAPHGYGSVTVAIPYRIVQYVVDHLFEQIVVDKHYATVECSE